MSLPMKNKARKTYCLRLRPGLIEELKASGVDVKVVMEEALEAAINTLKSSKGSRHTK